MTTRYLLTLCTALFASGAFVAGLANALGQADEKTPVKTSSNEIVRTQENAFFDRHIDNAVKHARAAELAGNQGYAPDLFRHAQLSLDAAKQAQRAGNVPGLHEGILSLREALNVPLSTDRSASERVGPCAEQRGDTAASMDCESRHRRLSDDRTGLDRTASDSPVGAMAACSSLTDAGGNVIYDDPTCPARYRHPQPASLQDATAHVRDARIQLSQAGGIRTSEKQTPGAGAVGTSSMAGSQARSVRGE